MASLRQLSASSPTMLLWAVLLALLVSLPGISAQSRCSNQTSNAYNISICPLASTTPPPLLNATILTFSSYDDGCSPRVYFPGWGARLYGNVYDEMYVCTNGHIDFGPAAYPYVYNSPIPVTLSDSDIAPMVAPFMADLYDVQGYSTISVSFEGTAPNRYAIVRWNQVKYYGSYSLQNNNSVTFDTVFYESGASYDVKYYNIDDNPYLLTSGGYYGIGNENNDEGKSWSVLSLNNGSIPTPINYLYFSSTSVGNFSIIRNALSGYSTRWTFTGKDISEYTCSGAGYDFSAYVSNADLVYTNSSGASFYYHPCGIVRNTACTNSINGERAMACLVSSTGAVYNLAIYTPQTTIYRPLTSSATGGVQLSYQNGYLCAGRADVISYFNYACDATATSPVLDSVVAGLCSWTFNLRSSVACGQGSFTAPPSGSIPATTSSLTSCQSVAGSNYTATLCPRTSTSPYFYAINQTNPVPVGQFNGSLVNSARIYFPSGFTFSFYTEEYSSFQLSPYGTVGFGAQGTLNTAPVACSSSASMLLC